MYALASLHQNLSPWGQFLLATTASKAGQPLNGAAALGRIGAITSWLGRFSWNFRRAIRAELQSRLADAPLEHAEALLAAYDVLQGLHDRRVFDLMRSALGSSDRLIEMLVEEAKSPEAIRALRNFLILTKLFGSIDSDRLRGITAAIEDTLLRPHETEPPSRWGLFRRLRNKNLRRGLAIGQDFLEKIGQLLSSKGPPTKTSRPWRRDITVSARRALAIPRGVGSRLLNRSSLADPR